MEYQCPEELSGQRLVCLDLETTGLSHIYNTIIELGVVEVVGGREKTAYSRLFGGGRSPLHLVRKVHGIRDADRKGKTTFVQSAGKIAAFLEGATLVTHNGAKFDLPFMEEKFREAAVPFSYARHIDTYLVAKRLKEERHSLQWLCGKYGIPYGEENHRGLADCRCTLKLLYAFCQKYGAREIL